MKRILANDSRSYGACSSQYLVLQFQAVGSDASAAVDNTESDVYAGSSSSSSSSSGRVTPVVQPHYSSSGVRLLTTPDSTLKRGKGPPPNGTLKATEDLSRRDHKSNLKPLGNNEESLLRVECVSEEYSGRLSSGKIIAPGRLSSPQRESIV